MARAIAGLIIGGCILAAVACTTTRGYVICNDLDANVSCPDNTANVDVSNM